MANTSEKIKDSIATANELKELFDSASKDAKDGKLQLGSTLRLIALAVVWMNEIATTSGVYSTGKVSSSTMYIISTIVAIAVSLYSYWKNNSWTENAKVSDAVMDVLNNSGVSSEELIDVIGNAIDSYYDTNGDEEVEEVGESVD